MKRPCRGGRRGFYLDSFLENDTRGLFLLFDSRRIVHELEVELDLAPRALGEDARFGFGDSTYPIISRAALQVCRCAFSSAWGNPMPHPGQPAIVAAIFLSH